MKALLVIDAQKAIIDSKDFENELNNIEVVIKDFKANKYPVIFVRNIAADERSPFHKENPSSELHPYLKGYADIVVEKKTPSSFFKTELEEKLKERGVDHVFIKALVRKLLVLTRG